MLEYVEWVDSAGHDGWVNHDDACEFPLIKCRTVGFVLLEAADRLILAHTTVPQEPEYENNVLGVLVIPKVSIINRRKLVLGA